MHSKVFIFAAAAAVLTACGGGGASGPAALPGNGATPLGAQQQSENAIDAANALGDPVKTISSYNSSITPSSLLQTRSLHSDALATCTNATEFFAPDAHGDPNSTETQYFYDAGCTQLAATSCACIRSPVRRRRSTAANRSMR